MRWNLAPLRACVLAVALALSGTAGMVWAQAPTLALTIATEPGGANATAIAVRAVGVDTTIFTLYLTQAVSPTEDLPGVRLFANLADDSGQKLSGTTISFSAGGADVGTGGLTVPGGGRQVQVVMTLTNLSAAGQLQGQVVAEWNGRLAAVPLTVTHYPAPKLNLVGADAAGVIQMSSASSEFQNTFTIESANAGPVDDLTVFVSAWRGPNSVSVPITWTLDGVLTNTARVPGLGSLTLELSATLPLTGTYSGAISLVYNGRRDTTALLITRQRAPLSVEVLGLSTIGRDTLWWFGRGDISFWLTLHETSGQAVTMGLPEFTSLVRVGQDPTQSQAQFDRIEVVADANSLPLSPTISLQAGETKRFTVTVRGLSGAGQYLGTLRLGSAQALPVDQSVTIMAKEPALWAAVLIFLGVLASYLLHTYGTTGRVRLVRRRRARQSLLDADNLAAAAKDLAPIESSALNKLRARLSDLDDALALGSEKNPDVALDAADAQLSLFPDWVNMRRRIAGLAPQALADQFKSALDWFNTYMLAAAPPDADIKAAPGKLSELGLAIDKAIKKELLDRIGAFEADLAEQQKVAPGPQGEALRLTLTRQVEPIVADAQRLANDGKISEAAAVFEKARGAYAAALAGDLAATVTAAPMPQGFTAESWKQLKDQVLQKLTAARDPKASPDSATRLYQDGYALYLRALIDALRAVIARRKVHIERHGSVLQEKKDSLTNGLSKLDEQLAGAWNKIAANQLREAAQDYEQARTAYGNINTDARAAKIEDMPMGGSGGGPAPELGLGAAGATIPDFLAQLLGPLLPSREPRTKSVAAISQQIWIRDGIVALAIFVIAVVIGMQLLWTNNPTWGGWNDYLVAVLWGLGLHQISGSGFEGVSGLMDRFSK